MKEFRNGVSFYTTGYAIIPVKWSENDVCCHWCKFIRKSYGLDRKECMLTDSIIYNEAMICPDCPIQFEEEEK